MRKKNSIMEFGSERSEFLIENFRRCIALESKITAAKIFKDVADAPAPRFWVTEARATRIITLLLKGRDVTKGMTTQKRKMYLEIYRRVKERIAEFPHQPLGDIVFDVINSPAPHSYITPHYAQILVCAEKAKRRGKI